MDALKITPNECVWIRCQCHTHAFPSDWRPSHINKQGEHEEHRVDTVSRQGGLGGHLYIWHWTRSALIWPNADTSTVGFGQRDFLHQGHIHVQLLAAASASLVATSFLLASLALWWRLPFRKLSAV